MITEKIFFSYSRSDSAFALKLAKDLRDAGADVWLDQLDIPPGSHWDKEIEKALNNANCLLAILSPKSMDSDNAMDEISYALEEKKRVIPVLLSITETPFRLRRLQRIDFTGSYDIGFKELLNTLHFTKDGSSNPPKSGLGKTGIVTSTTEQSTSEKQGKDVLDASPKNTIEDHKEETGIPTPEQKKPRTNKRFLLIGSVLVIALVSWCLWQINKKTGPLIPDRKDQEAWAAALKKNDVISLKSYLDAYPGGQYVLMAQRKIDSLMKVQLSVLDDEQVWNATVLNHTTAGFLDYIKRYPQGKHFKEAEDSFARLNNQPQRKQQKNRGENHTKQPPDIVSRTDQKERDELAWNTAVTSGSIAAFENYTTSYANGRYAKQAKEKLDSLYQQQKSDQQKQEDEQAWNMAVNMATIGAFQNYQNKYPNGKYSKDAKDKITNLQNQLDDQQAWTTSRSANTLESYQRYINKYPNGKYIESAMAMVEDLKKRQEKQAYVIAFNANTIQSYQEYLMQYPNGRYAAQARERIASLQQTSTQDISGTWVSSNASTGRITKLIISGKSIHAYSKCLPSDCDWKAVAISSNGNNNFSAVFNIGIQRSTIKILHQNDILRVSEAVAFNNRPTQYNSYTFKKSVSIINIKGNKLVQKNIK